MSKLPSLFITGTDTEVGKTVITALLGLLYQDAGLKVACFKAVQTGAVRRANGLLAPDVLFYAAMLGLDEDLKTFCPYVFEPPLSPHLAARLAGVKIDPARIGEHYTALAGRYDAVLVEGAGGLMVPLGENYFIRDLISDLGLPTLVVARPGLGTINHTLLTVTCARQASLTVAGVAINRYPSAPDPAAQDNPAAIATLGKVNVLAVVPEIATLDNEVRSRPALLAAARRLEKTYRITAELENLAVTR